MLIKTDLDAIIDYFLNLFRIQSGVKDLQEDFTEVKQLTDPSKSKQSICELRVKKRGKWKSRRITVEPLGQNVESRSACYKVVYDDILVIKIPPQPIRDFDAYLENILIESHISSRLFPEIMCVRPTVSTILRKIPDLRFKTSYPSDILDEKYIELLQERPGLQTFLKIGSTFVFFMNLSKYMFYEQILNSIHGRPQDIESEILKNGGSLWDLDAFINLYGTDKDGIFLQMSNILSSYEHCIERLGEESDEIASLPHFHHKKWLLMRLAGKPFDEKADGLSNESIRLLNLTFRAIENKYSRVFSEFQNMVSNHVNTMNFNKNRMVIRGMIINILRLLYHLQKKGVAIRDLKPDNMFIKGDMDHGDLILNKSEGYTLGLIDLETAVNQTENDMEQPVLAGTPGYCTPSHLFSTDLLEKIFPNIYQIYYLQDWFSSIGMIFYTIVGEPLFHETGKLVMEIYRIRERETGMIENPVETMKHVSWVFWNTAVSEFQFKLGKAENRLRSFKIPLPISVQKMLREEILQQLRLSSEKLSKVMIDNPVKINKEHEHGPVPTFLRKSESGIPKEKGRSGKQSPTAAWLESVSSLKDRMSHLSGLSRKVLDDLSAYELLNILFLLVFLPMYPASWMDRKQPQILDEPF
jgi:serine/threonine protein kinase